MGSRCASCAVYVYKCTCAYRAQEAHRDPTMYMIYIYKHITINRSITTGWRRCIGFLELQVTFCTRAINSRARLRKTTYKDKASYGSSPPGMMLLRLVGSIKLYVSFAEYGLFHSVLLPKETCNLIDPTIQSHPISIYICIYISKDLLGGTQWPHYAYTNTYTYSLYIYIKIVN